MNIGDWYLLMTQMKKHSIQFKKLICSGIPTWGDGLYVLGKPAGYDGTNNDVLTPFVINDECFIPLV